MQHESEIEIVNFCPHGLKAMAGLPSIVEHLQGPRPGEYNFIVPITLIGAFGISFLLIPHLWSLRYTGTEATIRQRSTQMCVIAASPLYVSCLKLLAVLAPRFWHPAFVCITIYEVIAFWLLFRLLLGFIDESEEAVLNVLSRFPPIRPWAVPPFFCGLISAPCTTPRVPCQWDLQVCKALLLQFSLLAPAVSLSEMLADNERSARMLGLLEIGSLLLAVYALFVTMNMTHVVLQERRLHHKFWSLKGTIMLNMFVFRIASIVAPKPMRINDLCFSNNALAAARACAATNILLIPIAALVCYAYPKTDLDKNAETEAMLSSQPDLWPQI